MKRKECRDDECANQAQQSQEQKKGQISEVIINEAFHTFITYLEFPPIWSVFYLDCQCLYHIMNINNNRNNNNTTTTSTTTTIMTTTNNNDNDNISILI